MQISKKNKTHEETGPTLKEQVATLTTENEALQETVDLLTVALLEG